MLRWYQTLYFAMHFEIKADSLQNQRRYYLRLFLVSRRAFAAERLAGKITEIRYTPCCSLLTVTQYARIGRYAQKAKVIVTGYHPETVILLTEVVALFAVMASLFSAIGDKYIKGRS